VNGLLQRDDFRVDLDPFGSSEDSVYLVHLFLYLLLLEGGIRVFFLFQSGFVDFILYIRPEQIEALLSAGRLCALIQLFQSVA